MSISGATERTSPNALVRFIGHVRTRFGIELGEKLTFVEARLRTIVNEAGAGSLERYLTAVMARDSRVEMSRIIDRLTTNHTSFFRESEHFEFMLETALPELTKTIRDRDFRIWCAAAATGEEPYTILMTLRHFFAMNYDQWQAGLLATDLSSDALGAAARGVYPEDTVSRVPQAMRDRWFKDVGSGKVRVKDELKRDLTLRRFNLMTPHWRFKRPFHVVFCRNVMIYFDAETRAAIGQRIAANLVPGGYLFLGMSEALPRDSHPTLDYLGHAMYRKKSR